METLFFLLMGKFVADCLKIKKTPDEWNLNNMFNYSAILQFV